MGLTLKFFKMLIYTCIELWILKHFHVVFLPFFFLFLLIHLLNLHLNERKRLVESWYKHNEVSRRKIYGFSNCLYLLVFIFVFGRSFIQV